jgi:hypothetical protein
MEIHVLAGVVLEISVHQLCKAPLRFHLVLHHLVSRRVNRNIQQSAQMDLVVPFINAQAAIFRLQIGPVYSTWQTDATQARVVVL